MARSWALAVVTLSLAVPGLAAPAIGQTSPPPKTIEMHAGTYENGTMYLKPDEIELRPGQNVTITLVNDDWRSQSNHTPHDVVIKGIEGPRKGGECQAVPEEEREREAGEAFVELEVCDQPRTTVEFTVPEDPSQVEFEMECEVHGHAERGMEGEVVVQSAGGAQGAPAPGGLATLGVLCLAASALTRSV